jgi:hypothetical protein
MNQTALPQTSGPHLFNGPNQPGGPIRGNQS